MKPNLTLTAILAFVGMALFSGCSSFLSLYLPNETLNSLPAGASVTIDGTPAGTTPLKVHLDPTRSHLIVANRPGWPTTAELVTSTSLGQQPRIFFWSTDTTVGELIDRKPWTDVIVMSFPSDTDRYTVLNRNLQLADNWKAAGRLTDKEHRELTVGLADFFEPSVTGYTNNP